MALATVGASDGRVGTLGSPFAGGTLVFVGEMREGANSTFGEGVVTAKRLLVAKRLALAALGEAGRLDVRVETAITVKHG